MAVVLSESDERILADLVRAWQRGEFRPRPSQTSRRPQVYDDGLNLRMAIIQYDAGDPDGTASTGSTGLTVTIGDEDVTVPIDACVVVLADQNGVFPDSSVSESPGAVEKICRVPQLGGANAYFRVPALAASKIIDVIADEDGVRLVGTIFDSWDDECAA